MLRSRNIDRICCAVLAVTVLLTALFMGAASMGAIGEGRTMGYETRLFDQSRIHTIDLVLDDWEGFLSTCTDEEYTVCSVVIDGEAWKNVGIRAKGNTSLSSVQNYGNDRYSFKIEFDHYESGKTYYGLDKLSLNNLIQDKSGMKDYLAYTLMNCMDVAAPLCSFAQIVVNGEVWGLYLAVEGVEEGFLQRNYGTDYGELYKPDSTSFGGGRGNGGDFDMEAFREQFQTETDGGSPESGDAGGDFSGLPQPDGPGDRKNFAPPEDGGEEDRDMPQMHGGGDFSGGGMDSSDVRLQYVDDDPSSYANIFDNAKTDVTEEDQQRLIASLKTLSEGEEAASVVDVESVIRYLVVHNFLCNDDSYTGMLVHNYYLYEEDGVLSMIPWDYNLAFGGFSMGSSSDATSVVNSPIDSPVSQGDISSRPMVAWIFESEEYTALYHEIYEEFLEGFLESGWLQEEIARVAEMIAPYVEEDPTAFYTYDEFTAAVEALQSFCQLRAESIAGQLDGSVPSTTEGQRQNADALVDASGLDLSEMGEFGMGGGRDGGRQDGSGWRTAPDAGAFPDGDREASEMSQSGFEVPQNGTDGVSDAPGIPPNSAVPAASESREPSEPDSVDVDGGSLQEGPIPKEDAQSSAQDETGEDN